MLASEAAAPARCLARAASRALRARSGGPPPRALPAPPGRPPVGRLLGLDLADEPGRPGPQRALAPLQGVDPLLQRLLGRGPGGPDRLQLGGALTHPRLLGGGLAARPAPPPG